MDYRSKVHGGPGRVDSRSKSRGGSGRVDTRSICNGGDGRDVSDYQRRYYSIPENNKHRREYLRQWREAHPEQALEGQRRWREAHPERARELSATYTQTRRARKAEAFVEVVESGVVFALGDGFCGLCVQPIDLTLRWPHPESFSIEHITPLSKGGEHSYVNTQSAHLVCNMRKHDKVAA